MTSIWDEQESSIWDKQESFECSESTGQKVHSRNWSNRSNRNNNLGSQMRVDIAAGDCARFIGKGGENIRRMENDSNARIKVRSNEESCGRIPVTISGDKAAKDKAKELVDEFNKINIGSKTTQQNQNSSYDTGDSGFDWQQIIEDSSIQSEKRWVGLVEIKKNFYIEDADVAEMKPREVEKWRMDNNELQVEDISELKRKVLNPVSKFNQAFRHYPELLTQIDKQGFTKPSPIQSQVWPLLMSGLNVIGIAQTGTGKTLAFLLPALIHIEMQIKPRNERKGPTVLVLSPTRELALQIHKEVSKYSYKGINCNCIYGGGDRRAQIGLCRKGAEIVVATPGRFNDLKESGIIDVSDVTYMVLDEADRMLDMGFEPQIRKILLDIRPDCQKVMTSATWPTGVERMAVRYMDDPFRICVGSLDLTAAKTVEQIIEVIDEEDKQERLFMFMDEMKVDDKAIVFVGRRSSCDALASILHSREIFTSQSLHGGLEQTDRENIFEDFKSGQTRVLIATDLVSRGLDVVDVTHVINYDFPRNIEEYVHRIGRTGRAGRSGKSISFFTRNNWGVAAELIKILEKAQANVPDELPGMAERFQKMKERRAHDRQVYGGGSGRRGGRGGFHDNGGFHGNNRGGNGGGRGRGGYRDNSNGGFHGNSRGGRRDRW